MIVKDLTTFKYKGIKQSKTPNEITKLIYRSKFLQEPAAIDEICDRLFFLLSDVDFNVVIPVNTTHSKFSLPEVLSRHIANKFKKKFKANGLFDKNNYADLSLEKKRVLIVDDVVYSGKTKMKAIRAVKRCKPEAVFFLAVASSKF